MRIAPNGQFSYLLIKPESRQKRRIGQSKIFKTYQNNFKILEENEKENQNNVRTKRETCLSPFGSVNIDYQEQN